MAQGRNFTITTYSAYAHSLRWVIWPDKFRLRAIDRYDGSTNPKEWLQIYSTAIEAASGNDYVKANYLPTVL